MKNFIKTPRRFFVKKIVLCSFFGCLLLFQSCISHESLVNYDLGAPLVLDQRLPVANPQAIKIKTNDVLDIKVHSLDILTAAPFNIIPSTGGGNQAFNNSSLLQLGGYLVDQEGTIDFPVLGTLTVEGLSTKELKALLLAQLDEYLKDPVVNIRFLNFKVTVSGEVNRPGSFTVYNQRLSLPEVLTMAGDLTPYADRTQILIVREIDGERIFSKVNIASSNFFTSDYYFLQQNDLIYIEPISAKRGAVRDNTSKVLPFASIALSVATLLINVWR